MADLSWGLCIATKDRIDVLEHCVACALVQTLPPSDIVVADSSAEWDTHRARIRKLGAKRTPDQSRARAAYRRLMWHRVLSDVLKDGLSRGFSFPQTRGSWAAFNGSRKIFTQTPEEIAATYPDLQQRIVKGG